MNVDSSVAGANLAQQLSALTGAKRACSSCS